MRKNGWKKQTINLLILLIMILGCLTSCGILSKKAEDSDKVNQTGEDAEATTEKEVATTEEIKEPEKQAFTMYFGGDVAFDYGHDNVYDNKGISGILSPDVLKEMTEADLCMINQEFPFGVGGTKAPDKQFTFKADPKYVEAFQDMGVDVVSLANNHVLDYGKDVLSQTFQTLDNAGIDYVGAGETVERAKAWTSYDLNGNSVAVLSASRVIPVTDWNIDNSQPGLFCTYDPTQLIEQIKLAEQEHDFTVVYVHWGKEGNAHPEEYQRNMAKQYIDAGADLIIGGHPHVVQGVEYYKGVPIAYSLGNYIFRTLYDGTMGVKVHVDEEGEMKVQIIPVKMSNYMTYACDGDEKASVIDYIESISYDVEIDEEGYLIPVVGAE